MSRCVRQHCVSCACCAVLNTKTSSRCARRSGDVANSASSLSLSTGSVRFTTLCLKKQHWCGTLWLTQSIGVSRISQWRGLQHTHTQPFNGPWFGTTRVGQYQKKHSPTHTHLDHRTSFINFLHLLLSIASSVFSLRAWQSSLTTSVQVLFGLPLGLGSSTSYSVHFFTQSSSSFRSTCPYQHSL